MFLMILFLCSCAETKTVYKYYPLDYIDCYKTVSNNKSIYRCFNLFKDKYNSYHKLIDEYNGETNEY